MGKITNDSDDYSELEPLVLLSEHRKNVNDTQVELKNLTEQVNSVHEALEEEYRRLRNQMIKRVILSLGISFFTAFVIKILIRISQETDSP